MKARYSGNAYICNECWEKHFHGGQPEFALSNPPGIHKCNVCGLVIYRHAHVIGVPTFYQVFPPEKFGYLMEKE